MLYLRYEPLLHDDDNLRLDLLGGRFLLRLHCSAGGEGGIILTLDTSSTLFPKSYIVTSLQRSSLHEHHRL